MKMPWYLRRVTIAALVVATCVGMLVAATYLDAREAERRGRPYYAKPTYFVVTCTMQEYRDGQCQVRLP